MALIWVKDVSVDQGHLALDGAMTSAASGGHCAARKSTMTKILKPSLVAAAGAIMLFAGQAYAGSPGGKVQIKVLGTAVLPDGKITARWYAGSTLAIQTEHKLDPWVLSAGLSYRF